MARFTLWISAEHWAPGEWTPHDDVTDVVVTLAEGTRWTATVCAFAHVATLRRLWAQHGEALGSRYVWMANLILVEDTSRETTTAVIESLLRSNEFESAFARVAPEIDAPAI